ncbi:MAG: Maf family protein [Candidatus Woesearchaeota archaeon]|nr:Maf family protein [Candidatus Woesearchaeota archaeon]
MRQIILASSSPRRKRLLEPLFSNLKIQPSDFEENNSENILPAKLAMKHALGKAREVASRNKSGIVIGADAFVVLDGKVLGKPKDEEDAFEMLKKQNGRWTEVISGVAVIDIDNDKEYAEYELTKVKMNKMTDEEILAYINTKDPMDKAGAFGMQDKGAVFVEKIDGCFSNVVGLPLPLLRKMLKKIGIEVFT